MSNRQATLSEVESKRQDLLDQVTKVKGTLEKHYQELEDQVKGRFEFDFSEHYEADRGQALLLKVKKYYQKLQKRFDKEEDDCVRYQDEIGPELKSVEVYQNRIAHAKQELALYEKQVKENGEAYNQLHADIREIKGRLESITKSKEKLEQDVKRLSAELEQSIKAEGALTNDLEQVELWLLEVNNQAIPMLQAKLTTYATQVSVMKKGLKDATATYQAAKTLQDSSQEAFKVHQELSDLVKVVKGENTALTGRLNLEVYVIRQYFQQILDYANANYIGLLTDNRYSFVLSEEGRRARDHFGLDINVYDQLTGYCPIPVRSGAKYQ